MNEVTMLICEALKPIIVSYPCKIGEHDIESTILVEGEDGEPKKKRVFSKHFAVYVASSRTASPNDIAEDNARRAEENAQAAKDGRDPTFTSRIWSDHGVAMVTEPGSGPFSAPETLARDMERKELVRIISPAADMANALTGAVPRRSLGGKAKA